MVDGSTTTPLGTMQVKFTCGDCQFTHQFAVMPEFDFALLLELDFLRNSGIVVDYAVNQFWYRDHELQRYPDGTTNQSQSTCP